MSTEHHLSLRFLCSIFFVVIAVAQANQAVSFKAGKDNVTPTTPGLFACKKISFQYPYHGGQQVKVFASVGHSVKSSTPRNGAAIWVEDVTASGFTVCVLKYAEGSNGTTEVNWIALDSAPVGTQLGTASLDQWRAGTKCETIVFKQSFEIPPNVFVTASHQLPKRPQDAMAIWVEQIQKDSIKVCLRETKILGATHKNIKINWMAFPYFLRVENFTLSDNLAFNKPSSGSEQENHALCQTINFTHSFYAPPVVVVSPKYRYNNDQTDSSQCNSVTAWIEYTTINDTKVCVRDYNSDPKNIDAIIVDYMVIGDLDPCLDVSCDYHGLCEAFGPRDARCVCVKSCPSYHEPVCSSDGTTYDNECLFKQEMCLKQLDFIVQHPGKCEEFPFQRGRHHMQHIPSLGYSHCETIIFNTGFYMDKPIEVHITVNHIDTNDVHDAAVAWVGDVSDEVFTACVMMTGYNERQSKPNVTVEWMAYQGKPEGSVTGKVHLSEWWTGTTCTDVNFPSGKFQVQPSVFATAEHAHIDSGKRDAASVWIEDVTPSSCKVCVRELQNYTGPHQNISVNWLAFAYLHKPPFSEHNSIYFVNNKPPSGDHNNAFCKDVNFAEVYNDTPNVIVSANHSSKGGNLSPVYNGITAWIEYIKKTGFRVCFKELFQAKDDPVSISYIVLSEICQPGWEYFNGYCYFTSSVCASWLAAVSKCSTMGWQLVTVRNQEENVYIQHRENGVRTWIGLNDRNVEGSFVWAHNGTSSFRFWAEKQPDNHKNQDCVYTLGAWGWYTWDVASCNDCNHFTCSKDINECKTDSHDCHVNALCENTDGSYRCTCKTGFSGNGKICTEIDECRTNSHNCDVNAKCENTWGSYRCTCKKGFTGDGRNCTDINECTNKRLCEQVCNNIEGSYKCSCKPGFKLDVYGYKCWDINECSSWKPRKCHANAVCKNAVGSYSCTCRSGYIGDGKKDCSGYCMHFPQGSRILEYVKKENAIKKDLPRLTVCLWMKTTDKTKIGTPFSYAVPGSTNELVLDDYRDFNIYIGRLGGSDTGVPANDGKWHHICLTWNANIQTMFGMKYGEWKFYKDGDLKKTFRTIGHVIHGGGTLVLGQDQDEVGGGFEADATFIGDITGVNIWDHVKTKEEIKSMAGSCHPGVKGNVFKWTDFTSRDIKGNVKKVKCSCKSPNSRTK